MCDEERATPEVLATLVAEELGAIFDQRDGTRHALGVRLAELTALVSQHRMHDKLHEPNEADALNFGEWVKVHLMLPKNLANGLGFETHIIFHIHASETLMKVRTYLTKSQSASESEYQEAETLVEGQEQVLRFSRNANIEGDLDRVFRAQIKFQVDTLNQTFDECFSEHKGLSDDERRNLVEELVVPAAFNR